MCFGSVSTRRTSITRRSCEASREPFAWRPRHGARAAIRTCCLEFEDEGHRRLAADAGLIGDARLAALLAAVDPRKAQPDKRVGCDILLGDHAIGHKRTVVETPL